MGDTAAVREEWRRHMGEEFPLAEQFLVSTGHESQTYPCPECSAKMVVDSPDYAHRWAVHEDHDLSCKPVQNLSPQDLVEWRLDWNSVGDALARALDLERCPLREAHVFAREIAHLRADGERHPAFLVAGAASLAAVHSVCATSQKPVLILTPAHEPEAEQFLSTRDHAYLALDDHVHLLPGGAFSASQTARETLKAFRDQHHPKTQPADANAIAALLRLAQELDANPRVKSPNHITVLKLYCIENKTIAEIRRACHCSHGTVMNRKSTLERKLGRRLNELRQIADVLSPMMNALHDPRARAINARAAIYDDAAFSESDGS
ncbi:MAG: hypothetical protein JXB04_11385 [Kiritimatiellae bacterium]|nr:hypothetical protein [Kiritimatiellia bacterium]